MTYIITTKHRKIHFQINSLRISVTAVPPESPVFGHFTWKLLLSLYVAQSKQLFKIAFDRNFETKIRIFI